MGKKDLYTYKIENMKFPKALVMEILDDNNILFYNIDENEFSVDILIDKCDLERVKAIFTQEVEIIDEEKIDESEENYICPKCKSTKIEFKKAGILKHLFSIIFVGLAYNDRKKTCFCKSCEYKWKSF